MGLRILSPGPLTTVQDLGRYGYERFGVPPSGAMDPFALRAANALVGNPPGAAGLEFIFDGPAIQAGQDCLVAAAGLGYGLTIQGRRAGLWRAAIAWRGEVIRFEPDGTGGWGYLAILGGIDVPPVMGSRSTCLRPGFGGWHGRALRQEDVLPVGGSLSRDWNLRAGRWLPPGRRPAYTGGWATVPIMVGPQEGTFSERAIQILLESEYAVSTTSDRMGYRLAGPRLAHQGSADLLSEPLTRGAVQVPADGQPMVMLADRPTTGGYPKIATVASVGIPLLVQALPGSGQVRFSTVSVDQAQAAYRAMLEDIESGIDAEDDEPIY